MNWRRIFGIVALLAVAAGGFWLWNWFHPPPEKVIRRQMEKLAANLSAHPEGNIARAAAVNRILSQFSNDILINGEGISRINESLSGKTELQQALFGAMRQLNGDVSFDEVHVIVGPEETNAVVNFTAVARLADQTEPYTADLKAHFLKIDGDWLIHRVDPINVPVAR
jgi:hypothetical protein